MAKVEPMDIDDIESNFDNKENSFHHSNVLPRTPCMEKGYEELDVSELNMKLRYSITPTSSPMSKSLNEYENNINSGVAFENSNLTRSLNSTITKSEMTTSLKSLPLQVLTSDKVIEDRNTSVLRTIEPGCDKNNITITLGGAIDNDENISLPSTSSSVTHTPEATTPTKEIPKQDGGSPIMRGLKSVLNMFRSSQSPIPASDITFTDVVKQDNLSPKDFILKDTQNNRCQTVVVSTPISNKRKEATGSRRSSPLKESIVFNDDLEKDLQWKDETTIFFKDEKIPIHKLFPQQTLCNLKNSKDDTKTLKIDKNEAKNITEEYMSMSNNASMSQSGNVITVQNPSLPNEVSTLESDGEFVDCEMTINDEIYNNKLTDKGNNTYEKPMDSSKYIQEVTNQNMEMESVLTDSEANKSYVTHKQCEVSDISSALNSNENILLNSNIINEQKQFETQMNFVDETHSVAVISVLSNANQNEIRSNIEIKSHSMNKTDVNIEHIDPTNVTLHENNSKECDVDVKENNIRIHPSEVPLPDQSDFDDIKFSNSTKDIDKCKKMCHAQQQDVHDIVKRVSDCESVTVEEKYKHFNDENEIKLVHANCPEINNHTNILKTSDEADVIGTKEITTLQTEDLQTQGECLENQTIDTSVNASFEPVTTETNENGSEITSIIETELSKKEDKNTLIIDSNEENEIEKLTSGNLGDENVTPSLSGSSEKNLEIELKIGKVEETKSDNVYYNMQNVNFMPGEVTNSKLASVDYCKDHLKSQLNFQKNVDLLRNPNHSTVEDASLNKNIPSEMLTTTINEKSAIKVQNSLDIKDRQVNATIGILTVMDSEKHLDGLQESDTSTFDKEYSATNTVEKYITESMKHDGSPHITDAFSNKIDTELLYLDNDKKREIIEKEKQNANFQTNINDLTPLDKCTNLNETYFSEPNTCAMDSTYDFNMDINKGIAFENGIIMDEAKDHLQNKALSQQQEASSDFSDDSNNKREHEYKTNNAKIKEISNSEVFKDHHFTKEVSTLEGITEADCLDSKNFNSTGFNDIILTERNESEAALDILNSVKRSEALQSEHCSIVNTPLDNNTINGINELNVTTDIPSNLPDQDTLVETIEVFTCQTEKKSDSKSSITINEAVSQEEITINLASEGKETDSSKSSAPKNVFNLPEMSGAFISKLNDNAATSSAVDAVDRSEHIFKVPSTNFTRCAQNCDDVDQKLCVDKNELDSSDVSTSSKASEETVHEVNTEDDDTLEAPFFETEEFNDVDKKSEHEDMIDFSDIPTQKINDNVYKGEMFIDAEAFQFLLNQNKSNVVADSGRESLFLKFDPLFAKRMSSDAATVNTIQKGQSTPKRISKTMSNIDFYRNANETTDINSTLESNFEDATVLLSKPMMVVNPAVNSVFSPRNKSSTPPRTNRRSHTFTSPAIAVIDRLLSLSGDNSALNHEMSMTDARGRTNETDQALTQLRELLAEKEINVHGLRSESKELTERLRTLESQVKNLEIESEQRFRKVDDLNKCLAEKTKMNKGMAVVVEEYERTIASLTAEIELDKKAHAEERMKLINERNEQNAHLASMTMSFNDLHSKYEKNKQIILNCKANEEKYKRSIKEFDDSVIKIQKNYELLKQHATSNLHNKNEEFDKLNRTHEAEILKYGAMIKRKEMDISSLKETLAQKIKANEELTAICDELLNKVA